MLVAPRLLISSFALLAVIGLACSPVTRTYENVGGEGGGGVGGDSGVSVAEATSSASSMSTSSPASSGSGMCAAVEDCFNGVDDDCNGTADCEDPACTTSVAVCAPQLDGAPSGIVIPGTDACPSGYTAGDQVIYRKLVDGGCTGCACKVKGTICTGDVWYYGTALACTSDANLTGGTYAGNYGLACDGNKPISSGQTYGVRTSVWKVQEACSASGSATPAPPAWGETMKFCKADKEGTGCGAGSSCVPQITAATHCALAAGGAQCGNVGTSQSDWYTGFDDTRTCGACGCTASGGSCSPMSLDVGSDYTCGTNAVVGEKVKQCFSGSGIYAPPVHLGGVPTTGTCAADAPVSGSLDATGQLTLCCQP